jgi:hypothetical protein
MDCLGSDYVVPQQRCVVTVRDFSEYRVIEDEMARRLNGDLKW